MDIAVRKATADDYEAFCRLLLEVQVLHVENEPHIFQMPPEGIVWTRDQFLGFLEGENQMVFLAEAGGAPVGFAYAILRDSPPVNIFVPRRVVLVDSICVTAAYRGCGAGKALMLQAESWGREHGAQSLELSVHTFNRRAISFYERFGLKAYTQRMEKLLEKNEEPGGRY